MRVSGLTPTGPSATCSTAPTTPSASTTRSTASTRRGSMISEWIARRGRISGWRRIVPGSRSQPMRRRGPARNRDDSRSPRTPGLLASENGKARTLSAGRHGILAVSLLLLEHVHLLVLVLDLEHVVGELLDGRGFLDVLFSHLDL